MFNVQSLSNQVNKNTKYCKAFEIAGEGKYLKNTRAICRDNHLITLPKISIGQQNI